MFILYYKLICSSIIFPHNVKSPIDISDSKIIAGRSLKTLLITEYDETLIVGNISSINMNTINNARAIKNVMNLLPPFELAEAAATDEAKNTIEYNIRNLKTDKITIPKKSDATLSTPTPIYLAIDFNKLMKLLLL